MKLTQNITEIPPLDDLRLTTTVPDVDRLLGGGFAAGETMLMAGEPGSGKSTFLMQLAGKLADKNTKILYVSGEESLAQLKSRAERLGSVNSNIFCSEATVVEEIYQIDQHLETDFLIVDSLQMLNSVRLKQAPGTPTQMRYCLMSLIDYAKAHNKILIVVGHSTKAGLIAGLLTLQHMVDTVWTLSNDMNSKRQILVKKNRFGPAQEGMELTMTQTGFVELGATQGTFSYKGFSKNLSAQNFESSGVAGFLMDNLITGVASLMKFGVLLTMGIVMFSISFIKGFIRRGV